jgi:MFS superfamily sulfate permease-like transporter
MADTSGEVQLDNISDDGSTENETQSLVPAPERNIHIRREPQNERHFEAGYVRVVRRRTFRDYLPPEPVRSALIPPRTRWEWLDFLLVHVPIVSWLLSYRPSFLINDIVSGVTVAIMHIPQGLAYALLADLPAVYGLYASFVPAIIYSVLGTSKHISVGTFAVVQLMIGNIIEKTFSSDARLSICHGLTGGSDDTGSGSGLGLGGSSDDVTDGNITASDVDCDSERVSIAITISLVSGTIMLIMGVLQLGFITIFLSESLVSGYTTGAAVLVFTSQLTHILGISNKVPPGLWQVPRTWVKSFSIINTTNVATLIIAVVAMAALIGLTLLNKWLKKKKFPTVKYSRQQRKFSVKWVKWTIPIPAPLVVLILATLISFLGSFERNFDVIIVGDIPQGAPPVTNPFSSSLTSSLVIDSFIVAIVAYSVSVSLARKFAVEHDYTIHSNQVLLSFSHFLSLFRLVSAKSTTLFQVLFFTAFLRSCLGHPILSLHSPAIVKVFKMVSWSVLPPTCLLKVREV